MVGEAGAFLFCLMKEVEIVAPELEVLYRSSAAFGDAVHELVLGALHVERGLGIGLLRCDALEFGQRQARAQEVYAARHFLQQLEWRGPPPINTTAFAVRFDEQQRHRARPMKIEVRVEVFAMKLVDSFCMLHADVTEADVFADDGRVLGFHQSVVSGTMRARLGLFDHKLVQKPLYSVVDELAAVVGRKATNTEWKLHEHRFEQWNQP